MPVSGGTAWALLAMPELLFMPVLLVMPAFISVLVFAFGMVSVEVVVPVAGWALWSVVAEPVAFIPEFVAVAGAEVVLLAVGGAVGVGVS